MLYKGCPRSPFWGNRMFRKSLSILLADDEAVALRLVEERLNEMDHVVVASVTNGIAVKKYLLEHKVDMVITDIRMPFMDGLELAAFIQQFDPGCQTAIISGYGEFEYARQAMQYGVREYLLKPVRFRQLSELIDRAHIEAQTRRNQLMKQLVGNHEALEKQISLSLQQGEPAQAWLLQLAEMMHDRATVVMLEQKCDCGFEKEKLSKVYRNILADGLPGQIVLCLGYQQSKFWFLLLSTQAAYHRQTGSMPEYLTRILKLPVEWKIVGEVAAPQELLTLVGLMGENDKKEAIFAACDYIREHMKEPLTRELVAEKVYLTPSYFSTLFKKVTGKGFNEYLTELRMEQAKKLLTQNISIREVGEAVGFRDSRYFSDVFCKKTGYLPSQFRSALLRGEVSVEES